MYVNSHISITLDDMQLMFFSTGQYMSLYSKILLTTHFALRAGHESLNNQAFSK